ncbi:MAG: hypothetical protein IT162_14455 [Bryobacterales bacterium]|nr:hypothetical protein [Bryobacterales bacterium]
MSSGTTRVKFTIGETVIESEWRSTPTAQKLLANLPLRAQGSYWGEEFYFSTPVRAADEPDATEVVEPGAVAFWTQGSCLCLFWGPTPASRGAECRAASPVNVVGRVLNPDALRQLQARSVTVERA